MNQGARTYKKYHFKGFLGNESLVQEFTNEFAVLDQAKKNELFFIIHLDKVFLGPDHAILSMEKFAFSYRDFLREKRDFRQLERILIDVAKGLKELHHLGYVHRDLKPENIVLDLKPLKVRLIDFNRCYLRAQCTQDLSLIHI